MVADRVDCAHAMNILNIIIVILLGTVAAGVVAIRGLDQHEGLYAMLAFGAHVLCSFAQWAIVEFYYGISSIHGYQDEGAALARLMDRDFLHFAPEVAKLALHMENAIPFEPFSDGWNRARCLHSRGSSACSQASRRSASICSRRGSPGLDCSVGTALRGRSFPLGDRTAAAIRFFGVPSVLFFGALASSKRPSSSVPWDPWALDLPRAAKSPRPLRCECHCGRRRCRHAQVVHAIRLRAPATLRFSFPGSSLARRAGRFASSQSSLLLACALSVGGCSAMGSLFPEYSPGEVAETMAYSQEAWQEGRFHGAAGGSSIDVGGGEARTVTQQLQFVPLALVNSLFRPTLFEAKSGPAVGGAVRNALLVLTPSLLGGGDQEGLFHRGPVSELHLSFQRHLRADLFTTNFVSGSQPVTSARSRDITHADDALYVTTVLVLLRRSREGGGANGGTRPPSPRPISASARGLISWGHVADQRRVAQPFRKAISANQREPGLFDSRPRNPECLTRSRDCATAALPRVKRHGVGVQAGIEAAAAEGGPRVGIGEVNVVWAQRQHLPALWNVYGPPGDDPDVRSDHSVPGARDEAAKALVVEANHLGQTVSAGSNQRRVLRGPEHAKLDPFDRGRLDVPERLLVEARGGVNVDWTECAHGGMADRANPPPVLDRAGESSRSRDDALAKRSWREPGL